MNRKFRILSIIVFTFALLFVIASCGSKTPTPTPTPSESTPVVTEPTDTQVPPTETEVPPTETEVPPTETEVPPTETEVPPTETTEPEPTPTVTPTPVVKYTVKFMDGEEVLESVEVETGEKVSQIANPTKEGFTFLGWFLNDVEFDFNEPITGNLTLIAKWEEIVVVQKVTVTFDSQGGTVVEAIEVDKGSVVTQPAAPTKEGYEFLGWFLNDVEYDFNNEVEENITLVAKWEEIIVEEPLYVWDFGTEAKTGYNAGVLTWTNSDGSEFSVNKDRVQTNSSNFAPHNGGVFMVFSIRNTFSEAWAELDFTRLEELTKISFEVNVWNNNLLNDVINTPNGLFTLQAKVDGVWTNLETVDGKSNLLEVLVFEQYVEVVYEVDGPGMYRILYSGDSTATSNTTTAAAVDNIKVYGKESDDNYYSVTLPAGVELVGEADLNFVLEGTELEFEVTIPTHYVLDELKVNGEDVALVAGKFSYVVNADLVITFATKVDPAIEAEVQEQLDFVQDSFEIALDEEEELTLEMIEDLILFDDEVVSLTVSKEDDKYYVTFTSLKLAEVKLSKEITVVVKRSYALTLPSSVEVVSPVGLQLDAVAEGTEVTLKVTPETNYVVDEVKVNDVVVAVTDNQFVLTVEGNTVVTVSFVIDPAIQVEVDAELAKVSDTLVLEGSLITVGLVEAAVEALVDANLVSVAVTLDGDVATVTLTSKKVATVTASKEIDVELSKVTITVVLNGGNVAGSEDDLVLEVSFGTVVTRELFADVVNNDLSIGSLKVNDVDGDDFEFGTAVEEDITLVLIWLEAFTVSFDLDGGVGAIAPIVVETGGSVEKPALEPTKAGENFLNWYLNDVLYVFGSEVTENITLVAKYDPYLAYTIIDGQVLINGFLPGKSSAVVHLPEEIEGLPVTAVANRSFFRANGITSFIGNEGLLEIGNLAFSTRDTITSITLPSTLTYIGEYAFNGTKVGTVVIPASIEFIGAYAFANTNMLEQVIFVNQNFRGINKVQFTNSFWLSSLLTNNDGLAIANDVLLAANGTTVTLPATVKKIGDNAFYSGSITSIVFNAQLEEIGDNAFGKSPIGNLVFPASLKVIGARAFANAANLKEVSFGGNGANIEKISDRAFEKSGLEKFELPVGLETISAGLFYQSKLNQLVITEFNVETVHKIAFLDTPWMQAQRAVDHYVTLGHILIDTDYALNSDVFPEHVRTIAEWAYSYDSMLTSITIPETVERIDTNAIYSVLGPNTISINGYISDVAYRALEAIIPTQILVIVTDVKDKPAGWDEEWYIGRGEGVLEFDWTPIVTVKFDFNGGEGLPIEPKSFARGGLVPALDPSQLPIHAGKTFLGWLLDGVYFDLAVDTVHESITLVANWADASTDYTYEFVDGAITILEWTNADATEIVVPEAVGPFPITKIAANAFANVTNLEKVTLPEALVEIGAGAFNGLTNLETVEYGSELTRFGKDAFNGTKWLDDQRAESDDSLVIINGTLLDGKLAPAMVYIDGSVIKAIESYAFEGAQVLFAITLEEGVEEVREFAFYNVEALAVVVLPNSLRTVGQQAFVSNAALTIDATAVYYVRPVGYHEDFAPGATVNWETATVYEVTADESFVVLTPEIILATVKEDTEVEFEILVPQFKEIKSLTANGLDIFETLEGNEFSIVVTEDLLLEVEFEFLPHLIDEIEAEFALVADTLGIEQSFEGMIIDITRDLATAINTSKVDIVVTHVEGDNYNVKLVSKVTAELTREKVVSIVVLADINSRLTATAWSNYVNANEAPAKMIDSDRYNTKWCDNSGVVGKYVTMSLSTPSTIGKISIHHAGVKEAADLNTRDFQILYSTDNGATWEVLVDVVGNTDSITHHMTPITENVTNLKFYTEKAEQEGNVTRIYDFRVYGVMENVNVNLDYNGGSLHGLEELTLKKAKGSLLNVSTLPVPAKEFFVFDGWTFPEGFNVSVDTLTEDITLVAKWIVDPVLMTYLEGKMDQVYDKFYITMQDEPTAADIKAQIELMNDDEDILVTVNHIEDNKYEVIFNHTAHFAAEVVKEIEVFTKEEGETVTLTFNFDGGVVGEENSVAVVVNLGEKITTAQLPVPVRGQDKFGGWYIDDVFYDSSVVLDTVYQEDTVFTAMWALAIVVTYASHPDAVAIPNPVQIFENEAPNKPMNPVREDYVFLGWFFDLEDEEAYDFETKLFSSVTLTAKWRATGTALAKKLALVNNPLYLVTEELTEEFIKTYVENLVDEFDVVVTVTHDEAHIYTIKLSSLTSPTTFVEADFDVFTKAEDDEVTLTFDLDGGLVNGSGDDVIITLPLGSKLSVENTPVATKVASGFAGWYANDELVDINNTVFTEDLVLVAEWVGVLNGEVVTAVAEHRPNYNDSRHTHGDAWLAIDNNPDGTPNLTTEWFAFNYWGDNYKGDHGPADVTYTFNGVYILTGFTVTSPGGSNNSQNIRIYAILENGAEEEVFYTENVTDVLEITFDPVVAKGFRLLSSPAYATGDHTIKDIRIFGTTLADVQVTLDYNGGEDEDEETSKVISVGMYQKIDSASVPTLTKDGYLFAGWTLNDVDFNIELEAITANITLVAKWLDASNLVTVTFDADGLGVVENGSAHFVENGEVLVDVPTVFVNPTAVVAVYEGSSYNRQVYRHLFGGWKLEGSEEFFDFSTPITEDITLVAYYYGEINHKVNQTKSESSGGVNGTNSMNRPLVNDANGLPRIDGSNKWDVSGKNNNLTYYFDEMTLVKGVTVATATANGEPNTANLNKITLTLYVVGEEGNEVLKTYVIDGNSDMFVYFVFEEAYEIIGMRFDTVSNDDWTRISDIRIYGE